MELSPRLVFWEITERCNAMMFNIIRSVGVKTLISLFVRIPALEK